MFTDSVVLSFYFETPLQAAAASVLGSVDRPVQRERTTLWPFIHATTVEASLRKSIASVAGDDTAAKLFGTAEAGSAVSIGDARLLLFPVRSSAAPFIWITCPAVIARLRRDLARSIGKEIPAPPNVKADEILTTEAWKHGDEPIAAEEVVLKPRRGFDPAPWIALVPCSGAGYDGFDQELAGSLGLVADEVFALLARTATEIDTVVGEDGAPQYAEAVPADTLFYVPLMGTVAKAGKGKKKDLGALQTLEKSLATHVRVGDGEHHGRGWARTAVLKAEGGAQ
jgi:CRISPR-associated protein Cmr4